MHTSDSMLNQWVIIHVTPHGGVYNNIRAGACLLSNCRLGTKNVECARSSGTAAASAVNCTAQQQLCSNVAARAAPGIMAVLLSPPSAFRLQC